MVTQISTLGSNFSVWIHQARYILFLSPKYSTKWEKKVKDRIVDTIHGGFLGSLPLMKPNTRSTAGVGWNLKPGKRKEKKIKKEPEE